MNKFIRYFFTFESAWSVLFGWIIVIAPQVFARFLFGQPLEQYGLYMIQLYGAMVAAWGAIYFYYLRSGKWDVFKGFAMSTLAGSVPTLIVLGIMIVNGLASLFVISYLLFTLFGFLLRVSCLVKPELSGLEA